MQNLLPRRWAVLCLFFVSVGLFFAGWLAMRASSAAQPEPEVALGSADPADSVLVVRLPTNDIVFNPADEKIYASVPGSVIGIGNTVTAVDPKTGAIGSSVFVGSEPNKLALAGDNHSLYASLDGGFAVGKFDTQTQTALAQFDVGYGPGFAPFSAKEIAVSPDNPDIVAVVRQQYNADPGLAIYNSGVQLPNVVTGAAYIAFSNNGSTMYSLGGFRTLAVDGGGVTVANSALPFAGHGDLRFENGTVITGSGEVIDAATRTLLGTFPNTFSSAFVPDTANGRSYYVLRDPSNSNNVILKAFSNTTFTSIGSLTIANVPETVTSLVKWGTNGLAFRTANGKLIIVQTSLRPTANPMPTPSVTPTPTPTPTPHSVFVRQYDLQTNDMVYSRSQGSIYVSVPSAAGAPNGNSIAKLNTTTGQVESPVFVGSEPNRLAISDDQNTLYVALDGSDSARKIDLPFGQLGQPFQTKVAESGGVYDMEVMPGSPDTVAVSRYVAYSGSVTVYDGGVPRANRASAGLYLGFASPTDLYAVDNQVRRLNVTASGVTQASSYTAGMYGEIEADGGRLYSSNGRVFDTATQRLAGIFPGAGYDNAIAVDKEKNRVFAISAGSGNCSIRAYELDTFRLSGSVAIPCVQSTGRRLLRWGTNGLAFKSDNRLYLVQTSLVGDGPVPTPTPTVSPTPTPTPKYVPTFIRAVDVPANDLVYDSGSNSIIASVPSSGGAALGNTLTHIDPSTGAVTAAVAVGTDPNKLAASDDGRTLYTTLDGPNGVRRYDVPTRTPGAQFALPSGFARPRDMKVMPANPSTVALAGYTNGVGVFDNGVKRAGGGGPAYSIDSIDFTSDPNVLYGFSNSTSGFDLIKYTASPSEVVGTLVAGALVSGYGVQIKYHNGLLYGSNGQVVDPVSKTRVGVFQGSGSSFTIDAARNRIFFLNSSQISVYDLTTFLPVGTIQIPYQSAFQSSLTRWGTNGLAYRTSPYSQDPSRIYLVQSDLVSAGGPMPTAVQLAYPTQSEDENAESIFVPVQRSGNVGGTTVVNYTTAAGTAVPGEDFTAPSGSATFLPGETFKYIRLPLINDTIYEGNETFTITLSSSGGGEEVISPSTATVTIRDNDPRPTISNMNASATEPRAGAVSFAEVEVRLSNRSFETIGVSYSTANGTAIAGADYTATSGILTFAPFEAAKTIRVPVRADNVDEADETFFVKLSAPTNATVQVAQSTVTIRSRATGPTLFDYDGDGRSDLSVRRPSNDTWYLLRGTAGYTAIAWGVAGDSMAPADYDGDAKTDIAVFRPSEGRWYIVMSGTGTFRVFNWGAGGDLPVPADRDGDGRADLTVFRPSNGTWYTMFANETFGETQFGEAGDKPQIGDFDADGRFDIAVFRPSNNNWYLLRSTSGYTVMTWGAAADIPSPADYDGDGTTDIAIFRPAEGRWYIAGSTAGLYAVNWGQAGDVPVAADFDGDGKADPAVFRPSAGKWYMAQSSAGSLVLPYGQDGDAPTQSAFAY